VISILLVEDNPDDEELAVRALGRYVQGLKIHVASDGQEAVDYLFKTGAYANRTDGNPTLVLLDLKLPKLDGHEVLKRIRESRITRRLPVVMMTTSSQEEDINKSYDQGVNSYIRKPVEYKAFLKTIEQLEVYWLLTNENPRPNN